jgi:uncharacterized DUF497 family protein
MIFEWDDAKNAINQAKHGLDFVEARFVLQDPSRMEKMDTRKDYGEIRWIVVGSGKEGDVLVLVYTMRADAVRIISLRKASKKERRLYNVHS